MHTRTHCSFSDLCYVAVWPPWAQSAPATFDCKASQGAEATTGKTQRRRQPCRGPTLCTAWSFPPSCRQLGPAAICLHTCYTLFRSTPTLTPYRGVCVCLLLPCSLSYPTHTAQSTFGSSLMTTPPQTERATRLNIGGVCARPKLSRGFSSGQ